MSEELTPLEKERRPTVRSASYPGISIEDALSFVAEIKKCFPNTMFNRDDISAALKRNTISRDAAAAVQYGLLEKTIGEGYRLSQLTKEILNPLSEEEKKDGIIACFKHPKLYADLLAIFLGHAIPPDAQFKAILSRNHNITELASGQVAEIFIENAKFSGLLNDNRILSDKPITANMEIEETGVVEKENRSDELPVVAKQASEEIVQTVKKPLLLEEMNEGITLKIHLTEKKFAQLIYPGNLNDKDIQIFKLQLEALALTL